jgi:putative transposase
MTRRPKPKRDDTTGEYLPNGAAAKAGLNKSILDAGWYQLQQYCTYKAESAGRAVLFVSPNYTSQVCSGCGQIVKKDLSQRWHSCQCGAELDRDHNAAINILRLGSSQRNPPTGTFRSGDCVEALCFSKGVLHLGTILKLMALFIRVS